jgi:hypothetical protein
MDQYSGRGTSMDEYAGDSILPTLTTRMIEPSSYTAISVYYYFLIDRIKWRSTLHWLRTVPILLGEIAVVFVF